MERNSNGNEKTKLMNIINLFIRFSLQLTENLGGKSVFIPLRTLELNYEILNFGWLNTRCLGIMDSTEAFHLHDVKNMVRFFFFILE